MSSNVVSPEQKESHGYMQNYDEVGIEKPADGLNGDCIVHYDYPHSHCKMLVKLLNGKREGDAIIYENDVPRTRLQYRSGELTGIVEEFNDSGDVVMRGHLVNGIEKGLFKRYTDSVVTWMGYYRNGDKYSEVYKHGYLDGFYVERCLDDDSLLSIAHYDEALQDKSGYCMEFVMGETMEWMVERGVKRPIIRNGRVDDGMIAIQGKQRSSVDEADGTPKRVRINPVHEPTMESMMQVNCNSRYEYGVREQGERVCEVKSSLYENQIIEADVNSHEMRVFVNGVLTEVIGYEKNCVDLNENGRRWEGNVKDGNPHGYGVFYNEEGNIEFEGFEFCNRRVCFGIEFYSDTERVKYKGSYFEGKRHGKGILYDRRGIVDYDGLWKNGLPYSLDSSDRLCDSHMESIRIPDNERLSTRSFVLHSMMQSLKRIVIGNHSLAGVRVFIIDGLSELESLVIGKMSCISTDPFADSEVDSQESGGNDEGVDDGNINQPINDNNNNNHPINNNNNNHSENSTPRKQSDGTFRVTDCPKLESIQIKDCSFHDYRHSFELRNLPSLLSIVISEYCFRDTLSFALVDLPQLNSLNLRDFVFFAFHNAVFENLPELQSIHLSSFALQGFCDKNEDEYLDEPYYYGNRLIMRNLPLLTTIEGGDFNFSKAESVILENVPSLPFDSINLGMFCFYFTSSLQSSNANGLATFIRSSSMLSL